LEGELNPPENSVSERMRADWNARAREDANYYVAFGGRDQDEAGFLATAADVLRSLEAQLKRLPAKANRRAWRALEIGCGPGRLVRPLSRHFGEIHGVDVSDEMIRLARERLAEIPHAHFHATNGASLGLFADESFEFIYSYAVFQHIPSREVVLEYMHEICRVLKPGGIFHGQFNGLAHSSDTNTWSGVVFSAADIRAFTREHGLQLLNLEGEQTQYMWTTWRRALAAPVRDGELKPEIRRVTNAYTGEPLIPQHGRHAAVSMWIEHLPADCDLNNLEVLADGAPGVPTYVGPADAKGLQQVNAWLPDGVRTGLVPVELLVSGKPLCPPAMARIIPAGPLVPRLVSITDGINLVMTNATNTGVLKVQIEEVSSPDLVTASVDDQPVARIDILRTDPRPSRYELNVELPRGLSSGDHTLQIHVGPRRILQANIVVLRNVLHGI
jgi:ubiquinone/menaquinone biosynthesis C-methylase UbiE